MRWRPFDRKEDDGRRPNGDRRPDTDGEPFEDRRPNADSKPSDNRKPNADSKPSDNRKPNADSKPFEDRTPDYDRKPDDNHRPDDDRKPSRAHKPRPRPRSRAERRDPMAAEDPLLDEFRRLRARVPQLTGALAAGVDGLVLAHDTPGVEPDGLAALTAAALGVAVRMTDATGRGDLRELLVRGTDGYVATYAAGRTAVLTLLATDGVNVGRLHLEGRRAGARIGELVDAEATPPPKRSPAKEPARPMPTRTRATRTSRATTANTRNTTES